MDRVYAVGIYAPDIYDAAPLPAAGAVEVGFSLAPTVAISAAVGATVALTSTVAPTVSLHWSLK